MDAKTHISFFFLHPCIFFSLISKKHPLKERYFLQGEAVTTICDKLLCVQVLENEPAEMEN